MREGRGEKRSGKDEGMVPDQVLGKLAPLDAGAQSRGGGDKVIAPQAARPERMNKF